MLHNMHGEVEARLQIVLESASSVALTMDHWTTSCAADSYLVVTVHFITDDWKFQTRAL